MTIRIRSRLLPIATILALCLGAAYAEDTNSPQAYKRTYAQNYGDLVLATCLTTAYPSSTEAGKDIGSLISALRDWSYYDMEKRPDAIFPLIRTYLSRNYFNPLVESDIKGVRFDFLKCLDLYHSEELDSVTEELISEPDRTIEQETRSAEPWNRLTVESPRLPTPNIPTVVQKPIKKRPPYAGASNFHVRKRNERRNRCGTHAATRLQEGW